MPEILMFTQENCPKCEDAKKKLKVAGVEYKEIDVDTAEGMAEYALHINSTTVTPAFCCEGKEYDDVDKLLEVLGN